MLEKMERFFINWWRTISSGQLKKIVVIGAILTVISGLGMICFSNLIVVIIYATVFATTIALFCSIPVKERKEEERKTQYYCVERMRFLFEKEKELEVQFVPGIQYWSSDNTDEFYENDSVIWQHMLEFLQLGLDDKFKIYAKCLGRFPNYELEIHVTIVDTGETKVYKNFPLKLFLEDFEIVER